MVLGGFLKMNLSERFLAGSAEVFQSPAMIAFLFLLFLLGLAGAIGSLIFICVTHPAKKFLKRRDVNDRHMRIDSAKKSVYLVDTNVLHEGKTISYDKFLSSFDAMDARRLETLVKNALGGKAKKDDFLALETVQTDQGKKKPQLVVFRLNAVDASSQAVFLTCSLLSNLSQFLRRRKRFRRYCGFLSYDDYLMRFRGILSREEQAAFYLVTLTSIHPEIAGGGLGEYVLYRLMDHVAIQLQRNRYIVKVDEKSFLFVDLDKADEFSVKKFGEKLLEECESYLTLHSFREEFLVGMGITARFEGKPILPLKKYVDEARSAAVNAYRSPSEVSNLFVDQKAVEEKGGDASSQVVQRVLQNKTWRLSFTPLFPLNGDKVTTYVMDCQLYGEGRVRMVDYLLDAFRKGLLTQAVEELLGSAMKRIPSHRQINLIIPLHLRMLHESVRFFEKTQLPPGVSFLLGLVHDEAAPVDRDILNSDLDLSRAKGIPMVLIFQKLQFPTLYVKTLSKFDSFLVNVDGKEAENPFGKPRVALYSLLTYLEDFKKPVFVNGIASLEQAELVAGRNVAASTCLALQSSSSRPEAVPSQEIDEFLEFIKPHPSA